MEYSIGSLADLITGSNTPNKPKVIQKKFKKSGNHTNTVSPKLKNEVTEDVTIENARKKSPNKNKKGKNKPLKNLQNNIENGDQSTRKKKMKKSKESAETEETEVEAEDTDGIKRPKKQKKERKRKLDSILSDVDTVNKPTEESPAKKMKLNKKEQNAEQQAKKKKSKNYIKVDDLERTIYIGNIPIHIDKKKVKRHFKKYGIIESIRIRGVPVADPKTSKKVAAIKKEFNPKRKNIYCFIRFAEKEDAIKAQAENGALFEERHLRVHICGSKDKPDEAKAIFVGNLSFEADEDELWKLFETCGPISYVRIIRDYNTGMGKGFAYVNFQDSDSVQLALEMENVKLGDRELRISLSNLSGAKKKKHIKNQKMSQVGKPNNRKNSENNVNGNKFSDNEAVGKPNTGFQGTKFGDKGKKRKVNKGLLQKKVMVKKIAPKHKTKD